MNKLFNWFRHEKVPENDPQGEHWYRGKKWRSSMMGNPNWARNCSGNDGMSIAEHFDKAAIASTSSPAILSQTKSNGHSGKKRRSKAGASEKEEKAAPIKEDRMKPQYEEHQHWRSKNDGKNTSSFRRQAAKEEERQRRKMAKTTKSSMKQPKEAISSNSQNGRNSQSNEMNRPLAATTEDIPDSSRGPIFDVTKKAASANEAIGKSKRPGILQRIRQKLRAVKKQKEEEEQLRKQQMRQLEELAHKSPEKLEGAQMGLKRSFEALKEADGKTTAAGISGTASFPVPMSDEQQQQRGGKRSQLQQQRSEDFDAFSQGRCSSFDYFSATASPTVDHHPMRDDEEMLYSAREGKGISREERGEHQPVRDIGSIGNEEEEREPRFATAAEARAFLRRQLAAERSESGRGQLETETEGGEETEFDADDEISSRLTASALDIQRPHSAMATSSAGIYQAQRESIYFTVLQPNSPLLASASSVGGQHRQIATGGGIPNDKQQQSGTDPAQFELTKQRSRSQILVGEHRRETDGVGPEEDMLIRAGEASEPTSVRLGRRKLRFVIPQVSFCSADDDNCSGAEGDKAVSVNLEEDANNNSSSTTTWASGSKEDGQNNNIANNRIPLVPALLGLNMDHQAEQELKKALSKMDKLQLTLAQRRQSNLDVVHQASGRRTSTTLIPLTSAQIHLIRSLWRQVYLSKGPTVVGSQISHRLFFKEPETREQFRRCPLPQKYVNHDSFSKAHCKQVSEMIDHVVESLDDLESVAPLLERIGRVHARISGGQLSSKLWNAVAETFIDCTLEWGDRRARSETVRKAWALIISYMVERIKHGHLEERRQITAIRSTIATLERFAVHPASQQQCSTSEFSGGLFGQQQQQNNNQLPVPSCPIRRVSASATLANGVNRPLPVHFSPEQFRNLNTVAAAYTAASAIPSVAASPFVSRKKGSSKLAKSSPFAAGSLRANRSRSDATQSASPSLLSLSPRKGSESAKRHLSERKQQQQKPAHHQQSQHTLV